MTTGRPEEFMYHEFSEGMSKEEREKQLNQRLREIVEYAYKNVPLIKDKFDKAGVSPLQFALLKTLKGFQ